MSDLIKIHGGDFPVDARELHEFLKVSTRFNDWFERRVAEYGFEEGTDFYSFLSKSQGGRPSTNYRTTIDMAKELCMVERNDPGRQARRYFIEAEKRLKQLQDATALPQPGTVAALHLTVAKSLTEVAGVKPGIAMATAYSQIEKRTGEDLTEYKKLLPPADHETGFLNATEIGERIHQSAREVNQMLKALGLQYLVENKKGKKTWRLTDDGKAYGEEMPYTRNGHSGYQIRWSEHVVDLISKEGARSS